MTDSGPRFAGEVSAQPLEIPVRNGVCLRELTLEDAPDLFELIHESGNHLRQYDDNTADKYPTIEAVQDKYREEDPLVKRFGIWEEDSLVGFIKLTHETPVFAEVGYWMGAAHTGKGYMVDAVRALCIQAVHRWGYDEVIATTHPDNRKSQSVLTRAGFKELEFSGLDGVERIFSWALELSENEFPDHRVVYELSTPVGFVEASRDERAGWFGIANLQVEPQSQRRGVAKDLLRRVLDVAKEDKAQLVYAGIVSRECIDAMRSVFGGSAVTVGEMGSYTQAGQPPRQDASASLSYKIPRRA